MAIDTRQKRFSMLNFGSGSHLRVLFEADGTVSKDDRQHLLGCYSGVKFGGGPTRLLVSGVFVWPGVNV